MTLSLLLVATARGAGQWIDISAAVLPGQTPTYPGDPPIDFKFSQSLDAGDPVTVAN